MTVLAYDRGGRSGAPVVVLLHAGVADRRMWEAQWTLLCEEYDAIRLDLRGFGESETPPDGELNHHEDVLATLASLGVERAHLVGCSLGAGVAVEVALARPAMVRSLLLTSPGGCLIEGWTSELRAFVEAENAALEAGDREAAVRANLDWWVDGPCRSPDEERSAIRTMVATMQHRAFAITADWKFDEAELDPPALERLEEVAVPTLVLSGGVDVDAIAIAARTVAERVPGAEHKVWPDVAHLPSLERPGDYAELLHGWLADG